MQQPERQVAPSTVGDIAAVWLRSDVGVIARGVWTVLLATYGPGTCCASALQVAALMGQESARSLRRSKGTPGALEWLQSIGAIDWDGDRVRYVATPAEADRPRQARPAQVSRPLPGVEDVDEDPGRLGRPPTIAIGGSYARSPAQAQWGEGGDCASNQERASNPPPPPSEARGGTYARSPAADRQLLAADVASPRHRGEWIAAAFARGMSEAELLALIAYYAEHRDGWDGPGVIGVAIANWQPGLAPDALRWPSRRVTPATRVARRDDAIREQQREARMYAIITAARRERVSEEAIYAELVAAGLPHAWLADRGWRRDPRPRETRSDAEEPP